MRPPAPAAPAAPLAPPSHDGGARVELRGLSWQPARRRAPVLSELDLSIEAGERVLLTGPSGSGKSTLLRAMAGLLQTAAHGALAGSVLVDGRPAGTRVGDVTLLLQDPAAAVVAETVGRDLAFGPENRRLPRAEIWRIVQEVLDATSFPYPIGHRTHHLSGGESQLLALAGGLALGGRVLLLDEPTSMLDEPAAEAVRTAVKTAVRRQASTLVVVEHRIDPWLDFADRLVVLGRGGDVLADGPPARVLAEQGASLARAGVWVPGLADPAVLALDEDLVGPAGKATGDVLSAYDVGLTVRGRGAERLQESAVLLDLVDATLTTGRALAVTGRSGSGKSTLLTLLAGLRRPTHGTVIASSGLRARAGSEPWKWSSRDLAARLAWSPQRPEVGMVGATVRDEVAATGRAVGRDRAWLDRRIDGLLECFGLSALAAASPYHLSGGEQRRLMIAASLAHGPTVTAFDEPTVGQDRATWATVAGALASARTAGVAVAVATHDGAAIRAVADESQMLSGADRDLR